MDPERVKRCILSTGKVLPQIDFLRNMMWISMLDATHVSHSLCNDTKSRTGWPQTLTRKEQRACS